MPYTKKTLADLKQAFADKYAAGVVTADTTKLARWVRALNEGVAYCADRLGLIKSADLTTVSGVIALPDDFIEVEEVANAAGTPLDQVPQRYYPKSGFIYWITGNQTDGFDMNTTSDETYTVYYRYRPAEMTTNTDVCVIPDPMAVVCYAYGKIRQSESDPLEDAQDNLDETETRLDKIISDQQTNDAVNGWSTL